MSNEQDVDNDGAKVTIMDSDAQRGEDVNRDGGSESSEEQRTCDSPTCDRPLPENPVLGAGEHYCNWTCASMARNGVADWLATEVQDGE